MRIILLMNVGIEKTKIIWISCLNSSLRVWYSYGSSFPLFFGKRLKNIILSFKHYNRMWLIYKILYNEIIRQNFKKELAEIIAQLNGSDRWNKIYKIKENPN